MPNARVGVLPVPHPHHHSDHTQQRPKKQGITMEDLKKQTALRLAQEQQQSKFFPTLTQSRKDEVAMLDQQGLHEEQQQQMMQQQQCQVQTMYQQPHPTYQPESRAMRPEDLNPGSGYHYGQEVQSPSLQPGNVYPRSSSMTSASNSIDSTSQSHKSKLPHGLTVHELKEMTKARLQAATSGHSEPDFLQRQRPKYQPQQQQQQQQQQQPQQRQYQQQPRHEGPRDTPDSPYLHQQQLQMQRGPPGVANVHMNRGYPQDRLLSPSPSQGMTAPPGFQSLSSQTSLHSGDKMVQQQTWHKEAWETGSVVSHNSTINSEYLDSESVFTADEFTDIPFNRTRSYPTGGSIDRQYDGGNAYDLSSGLTPNRRRAATLSPRLGLPAAVMSPRHGLSHLHEDRPSFGGPELSIPFETSLRNPISLRPLPAPADLNNDYPLRSRTYSGNAVPNEGFAFNRPRTASAPSVSTFMSQTSDMFGNADMASLSSGHNEHLPSSIVESILGGSTSSLPRDNSDYASVFRSPSQDGTGLSNPWGATNVGGVQGGVTNRHSADTQLANKFGSVFSLSGIEPPPGSYAPRPTDRVYLFPSLSNTSAPTTNDSADHQAHGMYGGPQSYFSSGDLGCRNCGSSQGY